jgi:hypothetical protein
LQRFPRGRFRATAEHARSTLKGSP